LNVEYLNMNYILKTLIIITTISFSFSCKKENEGDMLKSVGESIKQTREITENFSKVNLSNTINLIITQDTINKIEVEAGENIISNIKTDIVNNELIIKDINTFNWVRPLDTKINVYLHVRQLETLEYYGSGTILSTNAISGKVFHFNTHDGSGDVDITLNTSESHFWIQAGVQNIRVNGFSGVNYIYIIGENFFYGNNLETGYTYITNISSGDCYIYATKEIGAKIEWVGDIYLRGKPPVIDLIKNGTGNLISNP